MEADKEESSQSAESDLRRIHGELSRLAPILTELTGLPSGWNGQLELSGEAWFRGKKLFSCGIVVQKSLSAQDVRWRTLIHESLHSRSAGYNSADYNALIGWDEGVVEQIQRLLRPAALARAGVAVAEAVFQEVEANHVYNRYITALEDLRRSVSPSGEPPTAFT